MPLAVSTFRFASIPAAGAVCFLALAQPALSATVNFSTSYRTAPTTWTVSELSGGSIITAAPHFTKCCSLPARVMTIPFTNNDGYWTADYYFTLPAGFSRARLRVTFCGADDRMVAYLNTTVIASCGGGSPGAGQMQFTDPGSNVAWTFGPSSKQHTVTKTGFVAGANHIQVIMNNTGKGIQGKISGEGPTWLLFEGKVIYQ